MANPIMTLTIAAAVSAAGLCLEVRAARASYGDAPWCLVKSGDDNAYSDCQYRSFQECLQARSGVSFCNVNPSGPPPPAAAAQPGQRKRRS